MSEFPDPCPVGGILYDGKEFGYLECPNCGRAVHVDKSTNPRWPDHSKASPLDELVRISEELGLYDE